MTEEEEMMLRRPGAGTLPASEAWGPGRITFPGPGATRTVGPVRIQCPQRAYSRCAAGGSGAAVRTGAHRRSASPAVRLPR